jgi:hypothetical protein
MYRSSSSSLDLVEGFCMFDGIGKRRKKKKVEDDREFIY